MSNIISPITIFGLSTEGYQVASSLSFFNIQTTLVDENLNVGMQLKNEILAKFNSVSALLEDEPLLGLESIEESISKAKCIFFAPKIRTHGLEDRSSINLILKNMAKYLSKGVVFINTLPTNYGGNTESISLIEKLTGFEVGKDFEYLYTPLIPKTNKPVYIGSSRLNLKENILETLRSALVDVPNVLPLQLAEWLYYEYLIQKYTSITTELELCKKLDTLKDIESLIEIKERQKDIYIETIIENLFDIKLINKTLKTGEPLWYTMSGILKSLQSYVKYVVNKLSEILKERSLKASRVKILVAWSVDPFEIREEKVLTLSKLMEKLHDYVGDAVVLYPTPHLQSIYLRAGMKYDIAPYMGKNNVILVCSMKDFETIYNNKQVDIQKKDLIIIKANTLVELLENKE